MTYPVSFGNILRDLTRPYAIAGQFGKSVTITDGVWTLHQSPVPSNQPLRWQGYCLAKFLKYDLGDYCLAEGYGYRPVIDCPSWDTPTWLSDRRTDPNERLNLAAAQPEKLLEMQQVLRETLMHLHSPEWQLERLGLV